MITYSISKCIFITIKLVNLFGSFFHCRRVVTCNSAYYVVFKIQIVNNTVSGFDFNKFT